MNPASDHALRLLDSLPALVWTSGRDARCNFFNKAWLEFTGREFEDELGDGWTESVHRGDLNDRLKTYLTAFRAREAYESEYRLRKHDGSYQWIAEEGSPIFDAKGEFAGFLGFARDVTTQKLSNEALAKGHRRLDIMASVSPVAIFNTDASGDCEFVNDRWVQLTGISSENSRGRGWLSAFHEDDQAAFEKRLGEMFSNLEELAMECRLRNKDGDDVWVFVQGCMELDEEGTLIGCVGSVTDLTQRKRSADAAIKQSKTEALEALAGQISFEFNNLLTPIILNLSVAQNQLHQPGYLHELKKRLEEAEEAAVRARNLTHRLLAFGKGVNPMKKTVDLEPIVNEAARFPLAGHDEVLNLDFPPDLWPVDIDTGQFHQVIVALVTNATEAIVEDGEIKISAKNLSTVENVPGLPTLEGPHVRLKIEDNGNGITPGMMEKVLDPYFSTKPGHSGLGITTAQSIVRKHGGHLVVSSEPDVGTICTVYLPAGGEESARAPAVENDHVELGEARGRILLMDDDDLILSSVRAILGNYGYEVQTASDGEEALEMYTEARDKDNPIAVTIMDLSIQDGMGGAEAIAELTALDPEAKAVVCSGHSNDPVMINYRDYGFKGAIRKPFHPDELNELLQELIVA